MTAPKTVEWSDSPSRAAAVFGVAVPAGMVGLGFATGHPIVGVVVAAWVALLVLFVTGHDKAVKERQRVDQQAVTAILAAERDRIQRRRDREAFERMLHPSSGNGLCDIDKEPR